jgi:hypothetical protein
LYRLGPEPWVKVEAALSVGFCMLDTKTAADGTPAAAASRQTNALAFHEENDAGARMGEMPMVAVSALTLGESGDGERGDVRAELLTLGDGDTLGCSAAGDCDGERDTLGDVDDEGEGVAGGGMVATNVDSGLAVYKVVRLPRSVALMAKQVPLAAAGAEATKTYAAQLVAFKLAHKLQQLAAPVPMAFVSDGSSAGDTPTPGYARKAVPLHSGRDDGDGVGEALADTDGLALTENDDVTLTDDVTDGVAGGGIGATRVELETGVRPRNDGDAHCVELMA